jgi:porphobilinogen synthase
MKHKPAINAEATEQPAYPQVRMRRLRSKGWLRDMVQEHHVRASDLIWPAFITEGMNTREPVPSMPGVERLSIDQLLEDIKRAADLDIRAFALFPVTPTEKKTMDGREALNPGNLICRRYEVQRDLADVELLEFEVDGDLLSATTNGNGNGLGLAS